MRWNDSFFSILQLSCFDGESLADNSTLGRRLICAVAWTLEAHTFVPLT